MPTHSLYSRIEDARITFDAIHADAQLREQLALLGYGDAELAGGHTLYAAVQRLHAEFSAVQGAQLGAMKQVVTQSDMVEDQARMLAHMARAIFKDRDDLLDALGLNHQRNEDRSCASTMAQARRLYDGALASQDVLAALERVGYTRMRIEECRSSAAALEQASHLQEICRADSFAKQAELPTALAGLAAWLLRLRGAAQAGLGSRADLLGRLES